MLSPRGKVEEVPRPEASLLALDEQPALAGENEKRFLIRFGVIDAALARLEDRHIDPDLLELDRGFAVLVREPACRAPRVRRPPLGISHVDDEPALRHGGKPGTGALKPRFCHHRILAARCAKELACASVREWRLTVGQGGQLG